MLLAPFAIAFAALALSRLGSPGSSAWLLAPTAVAAASSLIAPIGEELGWRGYAQPRLQRWLSPLGTGLLLGLVWAVWHLPMALVPGTTQHDLPFPVFTVMIVGASLLFVWVANHTGGSVLAAMLLHAAANLSFNTVPVFPRFSGELDGAVLLAVLYLVAGLLAVLRSPGRSGPAARRPRAGLDRRVAVGLSVAMVAYLAVVNHVDLYPWNDLAAAGPQWASTLSGVVPFTLAAVACWRGWLPAMVYFAGHGWVWLGLQVWNWWVPYLGGGERRFAGDYTRTLHPLPELMGRPGPDAQHLVLQALSLVVAVALTVATAQVARRGRAGRSSADRDIRPRQQGVLLEPGSM